MGTISFSASSTHILDLNRSTLQELARIRLREARALLANRHYDGAYYLAGYAVECALKACVARKTRRYDFPDKRIVNKSHTHDLESLVKLAGLEPQRTRQERENQAFARNWAVVKDWNEESRYRTIGEARARDLYAAISRRQHGVMRWIRQYW